MTHSYFLGEEGEAAYTRLERSLRLGPDSGRASVASDSVDVRYEVRRRVGEILRVEVVRPGGDVVRRIHEVVQAAGSPVLVWIEAEPGVGAESEAWRRAYAALNMGRDVLADKGKLSLVLAGPVALDEQVRMRAPDLVSVMRPMLVLGTRLDPVAEAGGPRDDQQQEQLAREIADVLARVIPGSEEAETIAKRAGFPPEHLPKFNTAMGFWTNVVEQATRGRIPPRNLVAEAGRQYPYNEEIAACKGKLERATHVRQDDLCVRLRRIAATKYRNHVFARLPVSTPKPLGLVWEAVVPLDFEEHELVGPGLRSLHVTTELEALVGRVDPLDGMEHATHGIIASPRRVLAILGEPGSGKTTLCRWLAATIAEREPGRAPILIDAVDWMSREGSTTLMDAMVRSADGGSQTVSVADLRCLCDEGRIVLLVDGYDEPVRERARSRMRDELEELSGKYPKVAIVVTSRIDGYLEAALPPPWQSFVVVPFDEGKLEEFVRRWYAMMVPLDPEARARGRAELVAALAAEPRAREMARNPLLATLIAEVHHYRKAPLPGRRSELYELVVELLLVARPRERGHVFAEMKEDDQRVRLERFALWLQEQRGVEDGAEIVFGREDFVREVTASMARREDVSRRVAQHWLEWLVRETGFVVDDDDDRYSFIHLSLMEYLAAQGLLARFEGDLEGLAGFLAKASYEGHWRETTLLLLGSRADDPKVASAGTRAVIEGLGGGTFEARHQAQLFLGLLLEEVDASAQDRERLLSNAIMLADPGFVAEILERVVAHSRRHGNATAEWLLDRISRASVWEAVRIAVVCPLHLRPEQVVASRGDLDDVAPSFLDESLVDRGAWAEDTLSRSVLLRWATDVPLGAALTMAISRLAVPSQLARIWTVAVLSSAEVSSWLPKGVEFGKHVAIRWESEGVRALKGVMPQWLTQRDVPVTRRPMQSWEPGVRTREGLEFQQRVFVRALGTDHGDDFQVLSLLYGAPWLPPIIPHEDVVLAPDLPHRLCRSFGMDGLGESLSWHEERALVPNPPSRAGEPHQISIMSLLAEVHAALLMAPKNVSPYHLILLRRDNLFIHDFFDGLASLALERGTGHDCLPLLLALGFSQYQTTWSWPRSHHWQQWFSSPPPADWLAAYFWHLCWAVGDVDRYAEHYAAAQACLDRADWPELAAELRAYTIRPMTVEEWQRNANPPPAPPPPEA